MQIIYDDKDAARSGDSFRLVLLNSGWHVVAKGYLCRVDDEEEGQRVIDEIRTSQVTPHLHIDKPYAHSYTSARLGH